MVKGAARRLALAFGTGVLVGAALTGHPFGHLRQMVLHGYLSVGLPKPAAALVTEFQPFDGRPLAVVAFLALLAWRRARRPDARPAWRDPAVVMAALCWALGFVAYRFWIDWSAPALATLGALELQDAFEREPAPGRRFAGWAIAGGAAVLLLLVTGSDLQRRWSEQVGRPFLVRENPTHAPWLPEPGGIAYSPEMGVFYALFFKNPDAPIEIRARLRAVDHAPRELPGLRGDQAVAGRDGGVSAVGREDDAVRSALRPAAVEPRAAHPRSRVGPARTGSGPGGVRGRPEAGLDGPVRPGALRPAQPLLRLRPRQPEGGCASAASRTRRACAPSGAAHGHGRATLW